MVNCPTRSYRAMPLADAKVFAAYEERIWQIESN
jgi:hypothetical protein